MNIKAEVFSKYLEEKKIEAFQVEEIADDAQHTVVYRSHVVVEGQQLPTLVLLDDSVFSMIRVQISPQARTEENELAVLRLISEQNMKFKPFKLYFDQSGALILDVCLLTPGTEEENFAQLGDEIYGMFDVLIKFLEENYRGWMKEIW
ncbi:hypothetical protein SAMN05216582_11011 [Selenomonas ruminantium]|uniref:Sensory transduction regulator n=1 Tax=Selenomonas ruminantium TaxID=971 RepID=A0A1M6U022_SELRU|nr:hypothetical protein [Selenomonas ruminantium]SHK62503.1 hypothetical protein SAMN05216582_11011 [Selenomonas ruminantium]